MINSDTRDFRIGIFFKEITVKSGKQGKYFHIL